MHRLYALIGMTTFGVVALFFNRKDRLAGRQAGAVRCDEVANGGH